MSFVYLLRWRVPNVSDGEITTARLPRLVSAPLKLRTMNLGAAFLDYFPGRMGMMCAATNQPVRTEMKSSEKVAGDILSRRRNSDILLEMSQPSIRWLFMFVCGPARLRGY